MLKRLFLVIFILHSLTTSALAGMDMSKVNQAEKSQMPIMHHVMVINAMQTMLSSNGSNAQIQSMMNCSDCDQDSNCHDLIRRSIHAATPFYAQIEMIQPAILMVSNLTPTLTVSIKYSNSQPELPPPAI
jgi:hypothetical protein